MANCRSCDYPYVPFKGKHNGINQYGKCPNCGYDNWYTKTFGDHLMEFGGWLTIIFFGWLFWQLLGQHIFSSIF